MVEKCYHGSNLIKRIYAGSNRIKRVYQGSTLVWNLHPYEPNTVIYESSTGGASSTLSLPEGLYQVICVGGGGGGAASYRTAQGGAKSAGGGSGKTAAWVTVTRPVAPAEIRALVHRMLMVVAAVKLVMMLILPAPQEVRQH